MEMEKDWIEIPESGEMEEFKDYLYERENADATIRKYLTDVKKFYAYLGNERKITKKTLLNYKNWLLSKYTVRSVNSMLAALNRFMDFLGACFLKVKRVKMQQSYFLSKEKELTKQEFQKLVRQARIIKKEWLALVMETIASTGIRISELKFFTVEYVRRGKIEIHNKGKYRKILVPKIMQKKLLLYAKQQKIRKGTIFLDHFGKPKDRSLIWKEMKRLKEKTGIAGSKIFPHNLRHLFARIFYKRTRDLAGLADMLGHSNMNVTRIYTLETEEMYYKQLERMEILEI